VDSDVKCRPTTVGDVSQRLGGGLAHRLEDGFGSEIDVSRSRSAKGSPLPRRMVSPEFGHRELRRRNARHSRAAMTGVRERRRKMPEPGTMPALSRASASVWKWR